VSIVEEDWGERGKPSGVAIAIVTNNSDPDKLGRVKLKFSVGDTSNESSWARVIAPMAGNDRGIYFLPEVGDEVLVAFEQGDIEHPYVIGALWSGEDKPPETNSDGKNNIRMIKSRSGHKIIFNDEQGNEKVEVHTQAGQQIILDDSGGGKLEIKDQKGNSIIFNSAQNSISISSQTKVSIEAQMIEIKAGATLTLTGGLVKIN